MTNRALGTLVLSSILALTALFNTRGRNSKLPIKSNDTVSSQAQILTSSIKTTPTTSWALDRIDQDSLPLDANYRHASTGRGVTVYVFDGGVSPTHPELAGRVRIGYSAFPTDPKICNGHGTGVAGAIAGATLGVAPEAEIVDVKMVQCGTLRGTIRGIVDGAKWTIEDHKLRGGAAIANWSFIADTAADIPALDSAVTALRGAGIPVIVSAGNLETNACKVSPANAKGAIVVGASMITLDTLTDGKIQKVDHRAPKTAFGPCVNIYAPGDSVSLPSLDPGLHPITQVWNGTSMAAGYVSGAAALYLEAHPKAAPDEVAAALNKAGTKNVVKDTKAETSSLLYVGTRDMLLNTRAALRR